jgi:glycerol-3-phosphate acyltransferase PlsX
VRRVIVRPRRRRLHLFSVRVIKGARNLSKPIVISIDAMGGDHGPSVFVPGVARALKLLQGKDVRFLLHGDAAAIEAELVKSPAAKAASDVRHTDRVIASEEKPAIALRRGKGSSLWNAVEAIRAGEAQAAVSGGNSGALMAISKLILRMAGGLDRPALVSSWPTMGKATCLLDVGANIECDADQLVEFAIMGSAFYRAVHQHGLRPTVGLMNVGTEEQKGHDAVREASQILRDLDLDFDYHGFVEGDDIAKGTVNVIVTDGFTGNVALKTGEGLARFFSQELRIAFTSSLTSKLGAFLARAAFAKMRARLTPPGGGPFLGLNGVVVKSHGGADAGSISGAIRIAYDLAASDYAAEAARNMDRLAAARRAADAAREA